MPAKRSQQAISTATEQVPESISCVSNRLPGRSPKLTPSVLNERGKQC